MATSDVLRVGVIGAGEVAQVIHLPTLALLSHLFKVVAICDVSQKAVDHCVSKFNIPLGTTDPYSLVGTPDIDVIFNLTSDQSHAEYTIAALQAGKHVFLEKPLTLSIKSAETMIAAEKSAGGPRIFVGTMRRYAPSFTKAFKREVGTIPRILYARSRGIIGPNSYFVPQSGTFNVQYSDITDDKKKESDIKLKLVLEEALGENGLTVERVDYWRYLGSLGSHDLSLMRETLGFPEKVAGVSVNHPFYSAIFDYKDKGGNSFSCTYESGIDGVPRFDSHLTVYGENKTVSIQYDTPYIKGLPIKVKVDELVDGEAVTREILTSFEDAYTTEMKEMYDCFVKGKPVKTSAEDSMMDLRLWTMMLKRYDDNRVSL